MSEVSTPAAMDPAIAQAVADANARFDGTADADGNAPAPKTDKPDYVPDEFWNAETKSVDAEAMARSYADLQAKLAAPKETPADTTEENGADDVEVSAVAKALAEVGLDFNAINDEYQTNGDVSPETRAKLEAQFGKPMVDNYFAGLKSQEATASAEYAKTIHDAVGGAEQYGKMLAWATDNLTPTEAATYDRIATSGDAAAAAMAAAGLFAKFSAAGGVEPTLLSGKTAPSAQSGYASIQAMTNDMKDPRYGRDAAFRQEVDRKVAASTSLLG